MDEYERMMFWAFGPNWMTINHKKSDVHFKIMHPEIQDLHHFDNSTSSIRTSYYAYQIVKHYYHHKKKEQRKRKWKDWGLLRFFLKLVKNG